MDKKENNINRRAFFKSCTRIALPIFGGLLLFKPEAFAKALESTDCENNCSGSCITSCLYSCRSTCSATCQATCQGACFNSCSGTCNGLCTKECTHSCILSCQNTSKAELEKADSIGQKAEQPIKNIEKPNL